MLPHIKLLGPAAFHEIERSETYASKRALAFAGGKSLFFLPVDFGTAKMGQSVGAQA